MSKKQETTRPKPSEYDIDIPNSEIAQALADLIEMGLVVDSGQRRFQNGKWRIVWVESSTLRAGRSEPDNKRHGDRRQPLRGGAMSRHTIPTPDEIDAVIFDMIAAEAARVPNDSSFDDLWSSVALDSYGEFRGYGFGYTPAEARAVAWITAWWPECDLRAVPRVVPEGWTFENYPPGEEPVFRLATHLDGDPGTSSGDSRALH